MAPVDIERASELKRLHADLFDAETRGLRGALMIMMIMVFVGASLFLPALAVLATICGLAGLVLIPRAVRRHRNVRAFCRDARLVDARILTLSTQPDHMADWYLDLEIPDAERAVVARVKRRWPRSSVVPDPVRMKTWYAPSSSIVISFDPRGEPILGRVEQRPLPRATLQR